MTEFKTPILFITFNRLEPVKRVLFVLKQIKPKHIYIASDGARNNVEGEKNKVEEVRNFLLTEINWDCKVNTLFSDVNNGCRTGPYKAMKWFFDHVKEGIILEDDILPHISFFNYCQELLEKYRNDESIYMISGRNNIGEYRSDRQSYHFTTGAGIWGWATWQRSFSDFSPYVNYLETQQNLTKFKKFISNNLEFNHLLFISKQMNLENFSTWDYQWGIRGKIKQKKCITPAINLIFNIGFGEDATHTSGENDFLSEVFYGLKFPLVHPKKLTVDYKLSKAISHLYLPVTTPLRIKIYNSLLHFMKKIRSRFGE